ncbi:hypothetical protein PAXRUDRAFT_59469, partial [Paxillus rubicundulus Ve08.2h10]
MPVCEGCQKSWASQSGHVRHLSQTTYPPCAAIFAALQNYLPSQNVKGGQPIHGSNEPLHEGHPKAAVGHNQMGATPLTFFEGDVFGSYEEQDLLWPDAPSEAEEELAGGDADQDDEEERDQDGELAKSEGGWEPPVEAQEDGTETNEMEDEDEA